MKRLITFLSFTFALAQAVVTANEQPVLACVTVYWRSEGCGLRASPTGARLREGDCAVDPAKIRFGSRVLFDDAARACGRNSRERNAVVIDRFFETKAKAMQWTASHPKFVNVWIVTPDRKVTRKTSRVSLQLDLTKAMLE